MPELLLNPAVQSGVLPALAAAVVWALVRRTRALALVPLAGLATVVAVAVGFTVEPMTARSKLVIALALAGLVAVLLDTWRRRPTAMLNTGLAALAAVAALWIAIRVLAQRDSAAAATLAFAVALWAAAMVAAQQFAALDTARALVAAVALGFGGAALGLLGASASVAMIGIALGAASGVALFAILVVPGAPSNLAFVGLPAAAFAALGGEVASLTGQLPWYALLPMALIPVAVKAVPRRDRSRWADAALAAAAALPPAAAAIAIAYAAAGGGPT